MSKIKLALALLQLHAQPAELAGMVVEPAQLTSRQMDAWARSFSPWHVCDQVCAALDCRRCAAETHERGSTGAADAAAGGAVRQAPGGMEIEIASRALVRLIDPLFRLFAPVVARRRYRP